ncbi:MAG: cyclic pyranopterin monophosphate synthase MoaC [Pseudomonadota bacterium]
MLTHVDHNNQPAMVNVSDKTLSYREASARVEVVLPPEVAERLVSGELMTKKGPVFATAIIAGTMAAKKTHELIPFCHQVPLDGCKIEIAAVGSNVFAVTCSVNTSYKTGVEMEALTGANIAALTIYDMCKALSHDIVIRDCRLMSKSGGKRDFNRL